MPLVAFPCGSASTRRVRRSAMAREAATLTAVVVLPTPPFWLAIATIRAMKCLTVCITTRYARKSPYFRAGAGNGGVGQYKEGCGMGTAGEGEGSEMGESAGRRA